MGYITPTTSEIYAETSAVTLARYAHRIMYPECAFFGVKADDYRDYQCRDIWTKFQRDDIAYYLAEAQQEIEDVLAYPLSPTWVVGNVSESHDGTYRFVDNQHLINRHAMRTKWGHLIEAGIRAVSVIDNAAVVDYTNEPAVVTAATTVTDIDEIKVYHPSGTAIIVPSSVIISGGIVTIEIPRCRLVSEDDQVNPSNGWNYNDLTRFETTVLLVREYTDDSQQVGFVSFDCSCVKTVNNGCMKITQPRSGLIIPDYSHTCGCGGSTTGLYYKAGVITLTRQMEDAIIRLAHSKLPQKPCGCDVTRDVWMRDRNIPDVLTERRLECPFGISDGAWIAWKFTQTQRLVRFGNM